MGYIMIMKTVCIYESGDHFLALSAREILEREGIIVLMPTEHIGSILPHYSLATAGHRLFVNENEAEWAREILSGFSGGAQSLEEPFYTPERNCPACGSTKYTEFIDQRKGLMGFIFLFLGALIPLKKRYFQCNTCGHTWK